MRARALTAALLMTTAAALAACGSDDDTVAGTGTDGGTTATSPRCEKASLPLVKAGQLIIGTDKPAYPPYFVDDEPSNGKGFESAVAYAIAEQLGFTKDEVKWKVVGFNESFKPGYKDFDFDLNQISITKARKKAVAFSAPYFTAPQAVLALSSSAAAKATSLAELKDSKLGVQVGTTSLDAAKAAIAPSSDPQVFNDSNDTVQALKTKKVDAIVVDLPTAIYLASAELDNAKVVGQFAANGGDQWGAVLKLGSELTPCVDQAIGTLTTSGKLAELTKTWITEAADAPELS